MRIMVTGAFGYFGTALCLKLAQQHGHEVLAIGRNYWRSGVVHNVLTQEGVDVGDDGFRPYWSRETVRDWTICGDVDAVVHLAGGGSSGGHEPNAFASYYDNVVSATNIARLAYLCRRKILASSIYVYGAMPASGYPFPESDGPRPCTIYGAQKWVAESVWRELAGTVLRFAHIYGAGSGIDFKRDGVTERMARAACKRGTFEMHGSGAQEIDLVHIDDACDAITRALVAPEVPPVINVGGGCPVAISSLAEVFGLASKGDGTVHQPGPSLDITLAKTSLSWMPRVSLAAGAAQLIEMIDKAPR